MGPTLSPSSSWSVLCPNGPVLTVGRPRCCTPRDRCCGPTIDLASAIVGVSAVVMIAFSGEAGGSGAAGAMKLVARLGVSLLVLSLVGIGVTVGPCVIVGLADGRATELVGVGVGASELELPPK